MEKRVRIIRSFEEAERADKEYYAAHTPQPCWHSRRAGARFEFMELRPSRESYM